MPLCLKVRAARVLGWRYETQIDGEIIAALSQSYVDNLRKLKSQTVWENRVSMMI